MTLKMDDKFQKTRNE